MRLFKVYFYLNIMPYIPSRIIETAEIPKLIVENKQKAPKVVKSIIKKKENKFTSTALIILLVIFAVLIA